MMLENRPKYAESRCAHEGGCPAGIESFILGVLAYTSSFAPLYTYGMVDPADTGRCICGIARTSVSMSLIYCHNES